MESASLDRRRPYKPLDFGNGLVAGSVTPNGRFLNLNSYHPQHGYVTLSAAPPFPDSQRHNQTAVRAYRAALAAPDAPTFGFQVSSFKFQVGTWNLEPETWNLKPGTWNLKPETWNLKPGTWNLKPGTWNLKPGTWNLKPGTWNLKPETYKAYLLAGAIPHSRWETSELEVEITTWAVEMNGRSLPAAIQQWQFHNAGKQPVYLSLNWNGRVGLHRASYTQLTESDPPGNSESVTNKDEGSQFTIHNSQFTIHHSQFIIHNSHLGAAAVLRGLPAGDWWQEAVNSQQSTEGPLTIDNLQLTIDNSFSLMPGQQLQLTFVIALGLTVAEAAATVDKVIAGNAQAMLAETFRRRQTRNNGQLSMVNDQRSMIKGASLTIDHWLLAIDNSLRRALTYALDCCALPVGEGICLLTDHQILPLSWTRDAYYVIQGIQRGLGDDALEVTRRHLLWLFETAQRPNGYWGRAYLANGRSKDAIFQLDQQCYPLLELAEYAQQANDEVIVRRLLPHLSSILETILARQAPEAPLFATEETPADDPMPLPYHFSSQVLLWHTLRQLAVLNGRYAFTPRDLAGMSQVVREAILAHFVTTHNGRRLFAYAADLHGNHYLYHDANDLPTAMAPLWGFCLVDDPVWQATMEFAFSPANKGGYYAGPFGGLGSVHTPGAWPLGAMQELMSGRLIGDNQRVRAVIERLTATACWDGALPEARDETSGAVRSRHWFAWPGAALLMAMSTNPPGG